MKDSLWEKKTKTEKDETTGEEKETSDYDWDAITKAVKSFIEDYNDTVEEAGESNTKGVLRNAAWMTSITSKNSNLLSKVGITIGKGNKLELDEDTLKESDISTLKTLFTGYNSYASQIQQKASSISNATSVSQGNFPTEKSVQPSHSVERFFKSVRYTIFLW
jgi:flagellar capping protein FliD